MATKLQIPKYEIGDVIESREGHRRRYLGTFQYRTHTEAAYEQILPRRRTAHWLHSWMANNIGIDVIIPPSSEDFVGSMKTWDRWCLGGHVVTEEE